MSKAVKLKNSLYLTSTSIVHKRGGGWHYLSDLLDNIYPVGSIHITTNNVNPSTYFGGTWKKLSGGYLYAAVSTIKKTTYTGWGTQSHILTANQIPPHKHTLWFTGTSVDVGTPHYHNFGEGIAFGINNQRKYGRNDMIDDAGGGQGHMHNIATVDVFVWKRTA